MKRILISFGTARYQLPLNRLQKSAGAWFDEIRIFGPGDLGERFRERNAKLLRAERGFGYWCWKSELILRTLRELPADSVLMYADSQCVFERDPMPLFEAAKQYGGIGIFHQRREGHKNRTWTRGDAFALMGCDSAEYHDGDNLMAGIQVHWPTRKAIELLAEWQRWCEDERVIADGPSRYRANFPEFRDHRHDQSIISLLAIQHRLPALVDPTQYGEGYKQHDRCYRVILKIQRMIHSPNWRAILERNGGLRSLVGDPLPDALPGVSARTAGGGIHRAEAAGAAVVSGMP